MSALSYLQLVNYGLSFKSMFTKLFKMYDRIYIKLFVQMFTNKKNFFFLSEVRFKNKLVDILVNWLNIKEDQSENDEVEK